MKVKVEHEQFTATMVVDDVTGVAAVALAVDFPSIKHAYGLIELVKQTLRAWKDNGNRRPAPESVLATVAPLLPEKVHNPLTRGEKLSAIFADKKRRGVCIRCTKNRVKGKALCRSHLLQARNMRQRAVVARRKRRP